LLPSWRYPQQGAVAVARPIAGWSAPGIGRAGFFRIVAILQGKLIPLLPKML
jgi:hypothetical protein